MDKETIKGALHDAGLSDNEIKIYLALLRVGKSKAGRIAKEAQIDRTSAYDSLKRLLEKGLISYVIEANRKWFQAVNPQRILEFLDEKKEKIENILPDLRSIYKKPEEKHNVTLFFGKKGVKSILQDILRNARENLVLDSSGQFFEKLPYYAPVYVKELEKRKIKVRHIVRKGRDLHPSKTTEIRIFPGILKETTITTNIYAGKIALIIWSEPMEGIIIENKEAYESYKDYFEILWKNAKR
ncbi:hypothetical protein HZA33_04050 [Candidatus Pacearchaeota archaeon]|nr:hypothetical protein [Candidatus Pacearchaeota archaeon]